MSFPLIVTHEAAHTGKHIKSREDLETKSLISILTGGELRGGGGVGGGRAVGGDGGGVSLDKNTFLQSFFLNFIFSTVMHLCNVSPAC